MADTKDTPIVYAGSCNPPRRAKRARTDTKDSGASTLPEQTTARNAPRRARPLILPKDQPIEHDPATAEANDSESAEEDDYDPSLKSATPKRRGRKPGTLSRSARESLRKLNHSRIEKARRTKINETLSTLSALVSTKEGASESAEAESGPNTKSAGKAKTEEKEFKLDVLVKTVAYMQELIAKVQTLEDGGCPKCSREKVSSSPTGTTLKRKRSVHDSEADGEDIVVVDHKVDKALQETGGNDDETYAGDDENGDAEEVAVKRNSPILAAARPSSSPRLPPIASWLPHPYLDPSSIVMLSGPKPGADTQLPSPPPSGRVRASSSASNVPALSLPGPADSAAVTAPAKSDKSSSTYTRIAIPTNTVTSGDDLTESRVRRASVSSRSPTWTPEDESAASLLLQMSSSPTLPAPRSKSATAVPKLTLPKAVESAASPRAARGSQKLKERIVPTFQIETPSSMLGLKN